MSVGAEGYQRVATLADLPDGGCVAIEVGGRPVVLVRLGDEVRALENSCPHAGAPLSEGFLEGRLLTCAWHGWSFDVETGCSADGAGCDVPVLAVRVERGEVLVRV